MERLTEEYDVTVSIYNDGKEIHRKDVRVENRDLADKKLFEIENIEKELGLDLATLFKALKQKFVYCIYDSKICPMIVCIEYYKDSGFTISSVFGHTYKIKDYGKTWALTKEELE